MIKHFLTGIGAVVMLLTMVIPSAAQTEDEAVLKPWPDLPYELVYDAEWDTNQGTVGVLVSNSPYQLLFISPPPSFANADEVLELLLKSNMQAGTTLSDPFDTELLGLAARRMDFTMGARSGFLVVFQYEDKFYVMGATVGASQMSEEDEAVLFEMVAGLRPIAPFEPAPVEIDDFSGTPDSILDGLVAAGYLKDGGRRSLFEANMLFSGISKAEDQKLYEYDLDEQLVLGAAISLRPVGDSTAYRTCGFFAQMVTHGDDEFAVGDSGMLLGIDSDSVFVLSEVLFGDDSHEGAEAFHALPTGVDIYSVQTLLVVIADGQATAFINGSPIGQIALEIEPATMTVESGYFLDTGCVMTDVWGYVVSSDVGF